MIEKVDYCQSGLKGHFSLGLGLIAVRETTPMSA